MAVSTRDRVSEQVADALVEKGNDQVLGSLAGNVGAELSRNAMETMVARSEGGEEALNEALVMRDDMPADPMRKMYNHVSSALREYILSQGVDIDESQADGNPFSQPVDLSNTLGKRDKSDKALLVGVYGRITNESAQQAVRFLRTRQKIKKEKSSSKIEWGGLSARTCLGAVLGAASAFLDQLEEIGHAFLGLVDFDQKPKTDIAFADPHHLAPAEVVEFIYLQVDKGFRRQSRVGLDPGAFLGDVGNGTFPDVASLVEHLPAE